MTFDEYQEKILTFLSPESKADQFLNSLLGLAGEVGELIDAYKKARFHGHPFDELAAVKELGDIQFYVAEAADALKRKLSEIAEINVDKLNKRYPTGAFTVQDSISKKDQNFWDRGIK